ncbi:MAG: CotH kinase family protein [Saprospiraceae bacterium]|nr:CotH kinase family protein [Saprospiraceae bacterium]
MNKIFLIFALLFRFAGFAQTLTSSQLPILLIETNGQEIPNEPKIDAILKIIDNGPGQLNHPGDPATGYDGHIGIEIRGASSAYYPQTPYGFETRNATGEATDVALLGMPAEEDWVLLSHYNDISFLRNPLAFNLFRDMGHYAPRTRLVEVLLNGQYEGIYLFGEKIKRDAGRVDISKLAADDVAGDDVTGGYIFKVDYWNDSDSWLGLSPLDHPDFDVHFVYFYPQPEDIVPAQAQYLQGFVHDFETALYGANFTDPAVGYAHYIDVASFIDYFIVQEVARNNDGFKKSSYFYKDKTSKGARLHAGPVWDFDWAWKNIDECPMFAATDGSGWSHRINDCYPDVNAPGWLVRLMQDPAFANQVGCRYQALRTTLLDKNRLFAIMDSTAAAVSEAKTRHFQRWPILGQNVGAPEIPPFATTYAGEITKLKTWVSKRLTWLDGHLPGVCNTPVNQVIAEDNAVILFPNPASDQVTIKAMERHFSQWTLTNCTGQTVRSGRVVDNQLDVADVAPGWYVVRLWDAPESEKPLIRKLAIIGY